MVAHVGLAASAALARVQTAQSRVAAPRAPAPFQPRQSARPAVVARGAGQEAVGSWIDLAAFVSSSGRGAHTPFDELADKIGRDVYIDVAGWHLYLKDVKVGQNVSLAQALASNLGPKLQGQGRCNTADLDLLKKVPIKLGAGRVTLPLSDLLPAACVADLERICDNYARDS